ncbi:MAG: carboxypeptidase regulatory-like domain-containing protein, partial [Deltaproteobacteria bacterium]|nr:carboxypeptidase regulatory-like domain-containing protein [Deltaproteobacteria bacterium]
PVTTGLEGLFEVRGVRPGATHRVDVQHPQYEQVERVTAQAGGAPVKVMLRARTLFRGRVVGEDGAPVGRFRVDEEEVQSPDGRFELPLRESAGAVVFSVQARGYEPRALERPAAPPDLGDVVLSAAPRVSGVVRDASGQPVPQALVTCAGCDESGSSGPDGRFRYAVPFLRGGMEFVARRGNLEGRAALAEGQAEVEITVRGGTRLTGSAWSAEGAPLEGVEVTVMDPERGFGSPFVTGPGGRYQTELPAGTYRFLAGGPPGGMSGRVMEVHAVSGTEQALELGGAPGTVPLLVRLSPAPGHCLWVVPGEPPSIDNPPESLGRLGGVRMVYEPPALARVPGLRPGRYTVVYGPFHVDVPGGPAVVRVEVPSAEPVPVGTVP